MNKFDRELNKIANRYILENKVETLFEFNHCKDEDRKSELMDDLRTITTKGYYYWVRKTIKEQTKVGFEI